MLRNNVLLLPTLALAALPFFVACSGDDSSGSGGATSSSDATTTATGMGGDASSTTTSGTTTSSTGSGPECDGPGYGGDHNPTQVDSVDATIKDVSGAALAAEGVQLCGLDICLFGDTDANGHVFVPANKMMDTPAFKFGDGVTAARFAILLPAGESAPVMSDLVAIRLPTEGVAMEAGKTVTSGPVSLTFDAVSSIEIDEINFPEPDQQLFRAAVAKAGEVAGSLDPALGLELVIGAGPFETVLCPAAKLSVDNIEGWTAGAAVEFYLHGVDVLQDWAPYGGWQKVSEGKVTDDGTKIETNDGEGLPVLSIIGIKRK